ncbi:MAG: hypothetical protein JXA03_01555 [Bacteroidales bacterium]|nr:hypothetical protein [Bacteroidales bacterium]
MKLNGNEKWVQNGMKVVEKHPGKKKVYLTYLKFNPEMAEKYLRFLSKNRDALYIRWNDQRQCFVG